MAAGIATADVVTTLSPRADAARFGGLLARFARARQCLGVKRAKHCFEQSKTPAPPLALAGAMGPSSRVFKVGPQSDVLKREAIGFRRGRAVNRYSPLNKGCSGANGGEAIPITRPQSSGALYDKTAAAGKQRRARRQHVPLFDAQRSAAQARKKSLLKTLLFAYNTGKDATTKAAKSALYGCMSVCLSASTHPHDRQKKHDKCAGRGGEKQ